MFFYKSISRTRLIVASILVTGMVFCASTQAQLFHGAAIFKTPLGPDGTQRAHTGDVITATLTVMNLDDFRDTSTITNIIDVVHHASGDATTSNLLSAPVTLDSYLSVGTDTVMMTTTYLVLPGDQFLKDGLLPDDAQAGGIDNHDGENGTHLKQNFFVTFPGQIFVVNPCLNVTKTCLSGVGAPGTVSFSGSISNCGNTVLTNVVVSNLVNGGFVYVLGPTNLDVGQAIAFTGNYTPNDPCHPATDTLVAWGTDELGLTITNSATATCPIHQTLTITCPSNITVQCFGDVPAADNSLLTIVSSAGATNVIVTHHDAVTTNGCVLTILRTYDAVDCWTNMATCTQTITVRDTAAPMLVGVPTNNFYQCLSEVPAPPLVTATDNCDASPRVTLVSVTNGTCPLFITNTWTASDVCSNTASLAQVIGVLDTNAPVLAGVPANRTVQCLSDVGAPATVTANDNCDGAVAVNYTATTNVACPTIVTRNWMASDRCGNTTNATQVITVQDTTAPVLVGVPTNNFYQCLSEVPAPPLVTATDNCDASPRVTLVSVTNGTCPLFITNTWTASDVCTNTASLAQVIRVLDTNAPVLAGVPANRTVQCLNDVGAPATVTANDNCDGAVAVNYTATTNVACPTIVTRNWMASDRCGNTTNATQVITVQDTSAPVLVGVPTNNFYQCLSEVPLPPVVTATDNCDASPRVTLVSVTNGSCPLFITNTWTATDVCTNTASLAQVIRVLDTNAPVLAGVPANRTVQCLSDAGAPATVTANDNCDGVVLVNYTATTNVACPTIVTRNWMASDRCGNTTNATQVITVQDTTAPVLVGVPTNNFYQCLSEVPVPPVVTATDNCDASPRVTLVSVTNGTCPLFITNTWTASDVCTNTASLAQVIRVLDTNAPVLAGAPANRTVQCLNDVGAPATVTANDNCDGAVLVNYTATTNVACPTIVTRNWMASDRCGNTTNATQVITVQDTTAPVLVGVPTNNFYQCLSEVPLPPVVTATDNCDASPRVTLVSVTNGTCPLFITNTWTASDACTNTASLAQVIRVLDTNAPVVAGVPANRTVQCLNDVGAPATVTANDNCDGAVLVNYTATTNVACPTIVTRNWMAVDRCGNTTNATQVITVLDTTAPVLVGVPTNNFYQCLSEVPLPPVVTATDNCDASPRVSLVSVTNGTCPLFITNTWTATDVCTNTASLAQVIRVLDTNAPVLAGVPANRTVQCLSDAGAPATVTANDLCDGVVPVIYATTTIVACPTLVTRHWMAVDRCGNTTNATQVITVQDTTAPMLAGVPASGFYQCLSEVPVPPVVTATDNCDASPRVTLVSVTNGTCPLFITNTWTATDVCTNTASLAQVIRVLDTNAPVLAGVPVNRTVQCLSDAGAPATVTANDNCDGIVFVNYTATTNVACPTVVTRHWMAVDRCGNTTNATQVITVQDTTAPALVGVPTNAFFQCLSEVPLPPVVTATDNCDASPRVTLVSVTNGSAPILIVRCWSAVDACSNSVTACQTSTVLSSSAAIGDFVWEDRNHNGLQSGGEPGVPGVVVQLLDCAGNLKATTATGAMGKYLFNNLAPGSYQIKFIPPAGYVFTTRKVGADDAVDSDPDQATGITACITVGCGETNLNVDAGLFRTTAIGDFVWEDRNHNGLQDAGEPGIPNVLVRLLDCAGTEITRTNTDASGLYLFSGLMPGSYVVQFTAPSGYMFTIPNVGSDDTIDSDADPVTGKSPCTMLMSGDINRTVDAGLFRPAAIGDFVWQDLNSNGVQEAGEPGIPGATVRLLDCFGSVLGTTTTDANGIYGFSGLLPGDYTVQFAPPNGYLFTLQHQGGNPALDSDADPFTGNSQCVTLASGETNLTIDAGLIKPVTDICTTPSCVIGAWSDPMYRPSYKPPGRNQAFWARGISTNLVFYPSPGNWVENSDGTAGLTGTLRSLTNLSSGFTVTMELTGHQCTPPPGSPNEEMAPNAYIQNGGPIDPSTWCYYTSFTGTLTGFGFWEGAIISFNRGATNTAFQVGTGANGKNTHFGATGWFVWKVLQQPASGDIAPEKIEGNINIDLICCQPSAIGDFVWQDLNQNGIQDIGEPGLPNAAVRLLDCTNKVVLTNTTTDANGLYLFNNLLPGSYIVQFVAPGGFQFSPLHQGGDIALDSDAAPTTGNSQCVSLSTNEVNLTIDAGLTSNCLPSCVIGAWSDPTYRPADKPPGRNQAIWMRGVSTNLVFTPDPGHWVENSDGTAQLTGTVHSLTNTTSGFTVTLNLKGRRTTPPSGSPMLELDSRAYVENGGPLDPATWYYYTSFAGTLTGFGYWQGAVLALTPNGAAFQVGVGANGKNQDFGASAWFNWKVVHQPASSLPSSGMGDFNLDLFCCAQPRVVALQKTSATGRRMTIQGMIGATYSIQCSTDMVHWKTITTKQNLNGTLQFNDPVAGTRCFYRVLLQH